MICLNRAPLMRQEPVRPTVIPYFPIPSVQVAGTNGKGSTCAFLAAILQAHGKRVGLYTSPHLLDITERLKINGQAVDKSVLYSGIEKVERRQTGLCRSDLLFFTACDYFVDNQVNFAIFETGLGGRLSSEAMLYHQYGILTHIALDHVGVLGNNLTEITLEKCGIIKPGMELVVQQNTCIQLIRKICRVKQGKLWDLSLASVSMTDGWSFSFDQLSAAHVPLTVEGDVQGMNALSALVCARNMLKEQFSLVLAIKAVQQVRIPGRLSALLPGVYCDVSHNPDGIRALCRWVQHKPGKKTAVVSIPKTKDYKAMLVLLRQAFDCVIYTQAEQGCAWPDGLSGVMAVRDPKEGIRLAKGTHSDVLVFCGSFAMVRYVNQHKESIV